MRLINTIEVSPYDYEQGEYPDGLIPIYKDAWLFDITTISDDALSKILESKLRNIDLSDFDEQVIALAGGIALEHDNTLFITPNCCGDIGAIHEWERMLEVQSANWQQLWIGHPWIYYRNTDSYVEFSDYTEAAPNTLDHLQILIKVSSVDLKYEMAQIRKQQYVFSKRIEEALEGLGIPHAGEIARLMTATL